MVLRGNLKPQLFVLDIAWRVAKGEFRLPTSAGERLPQHRWLCWVRSLGWKYTGFTSRICHSLTTRGAPETKWSASHSVSCRLMTVASGRRSDGTSRQAARLSTCCSSGTWAGRFPSGSRRRSQFHVANRRAPACTAALRTSGRHDDAVSEFWCSGREVLELAERSYSCFIPSPCSLSVLRPNERRVRAVPSFFSGIPEPLSRMIT